MTPLEDLRRQLLEGGGQNIGNAPPATAPSGMRPGSPDLQSPVPPAHGSVDEEVAHRRDFYHQQRLTAENSAAEGDTKAQATAHQIHQKLGRPDPAYATREDEDRSSTDMALNATSLGGGPAVGVLKHAAQEIMPHLAESIGAMITKAMTKTAGKDIAASAESQGLRKFAEIPKTKAAVKSAAPAAPAAAPKTAQAPTAAPGRPTIANAKVAPKPAPKAAAPQAPARRTKLTAMSERGRAVGRKAGEGETMGDLPITKGKIVSTTRVRDQGPRRTVTTKNANGSGSSASGPRENFAPKTEAKPTAKRLTRPQADAKQRLADVGEHLDPKVRAEVESAARGEGTIPASEANRIASKPFGRRTKAEDKDLARYNAEGKPTEPVTKVSEKSAETEVKAPVKAKATTPAATVKPAASSVANEAKAKIKANAAAKSQAKRDAATSSVTAPVTKAAPKSGNAFDRAREAQGKPAAETAKKTVTPTAAASKPFEAKKGLESLGGKEFSDITGYVQHTLKTTARDSKELADLARGSLKGESNALTEGVREYVRKAYGIPTMSRTEMARLMQQIQKGAPGYAE